MIERIQKAFDKAVEKYKAAYELEFDYKEDYELNEAEWNYCQGLRDEIGQLQWILNGESVRVEYNKDKVIIRFSNGTKKEI